MKLYRFFEKWVAMNAPEITYSHFSSPPKFPSKVWLPAFHYTNGESARIPHKIGHKLLGASRGLMVPGSVSLCTTDLFTQSGSVPHTEILWNCKVGWGMWKWRVLPPLSQEYALC